MNKPGLPDTLKSFLWITLGSVLYALGFDGLYVPNQIGFGGITSLGQIANFLLPALPIGAVVMTKKVADHMGPGSHGSTFGGNPVVCAGALVVMDELTDELLARDRALADYLRAELKKLPHVTEVSGLGLMVGIAFEEGIGAAAVRTACEQQGLLVLTAKTRLRLLPPLILTQEDVDKALAILRTVLEKL